MAKSRITRPVPVPDIDDVSYWEALSEDRFVAPVCTDCQLGWMRPTPTCPRCGGSGSELRDVGSIATIYSWVGVHRALDPSFDDETPYVILLLKAESGARFFARLLGPQPEAPIIGNHVRLETYVQDGHHLPGARLLPQDAAS